MADTATILDKAKALHELLETHELAVKARESEKALEDNRQAMRDMTDFQRFAQQLAEKQQSGQPIEAHEKQRLSDLQTAVANNPLLIGYQKAQMNYMDLLIQVQGIILGEDTSQAAPPVAPPSAGPLITG